MQGRLWWVLAPRALCISLTWPEKLAASVESPRFCIELHGMDQPERRKATSAWPYPGVLHRSEANTCRSAIRESSCFSN